MAEQQQQSFNDFIQEGRKKRKAEELAQEIFGKNRRSSAPPTGPKAGLGGSLASRVGVTKLERNSSLPRSNPARQPRQPSSLSRSTNDSQRPKLPHTRTAPVDLTAKSKSNGTAQQEVLNGGNELSIRGAASGPYMVIAQNFAPGTTAADIESVMSSVGGQVTGCKLVASNPTVIAEMAFVEKKGAEDVIETFNNKKADGRTLYVYWKHGVGAPKSSGTTQRPAEPQTPTVGASASEDVAMEVDENAESREAQDRLREQRRGRDDRARQEVFPTGPRAQQTELDDYRDRRSRRPEPEYQDGRYGYGRGYGDSGRGWYPRGSERRYGRGTSWRP